MNQEQQLFDLIEIIKVLAHPTRLKIIRLLNEQGETNVSSFQAHLMADQSLISHHLLRMKDAGVLVNMRKGKAIYYALADPSLIKVVTLLLNRTN